MKTDASPLDPLCAEDMCSFMVSLEIQILRKNAANMSRAEILKWLDKISKNFKDHRSTMQKLCEDLRDDASSISRQRDCLIDLIVNMARVIVDNDVEILMPFVTRLRNLSAEQVFYSEKHVYP